MSSKINLRNCLLLALTLPLLISVACSLPPIIPYTADTLGQSDGSRASIRILSAVTSTPGGACTPPRENNDFICKYQVRWEIEYWLPEAATIDCVVYRDGEQVTFYGEGFEEGEGTWVDELMVSNFYESMGQYTEQLVCSVHEGNREGEVWGSDAKDYQVALTTTWED
jgi:hypothetical protein